MVYHKSLFIAYLFLILKVYICHASCPDDCLCEDKIVKCSQAVKIDLIPEDTEWLIFSRNSFGESMKISTRTMSSLNTLKHLDISENVINCSCSLVNELKLVSKNTSVEGAYCIFDEQKWNLLDLTCDDLPDDCKSNKKKCHVNAECRESEDGSSCYCKRGFKGSGLMCKDINECENEEVCGANSKCQNTLGSYICSCYTGYKWNGTECKDINECESLADCFNNQQCENLPGSFRCNCNPGFYKVSGYPDYCEDIDECKGKTSKCFKLSTCTNTVGSYKCGPCPKHYVGDGVLCHPTCKISKCPGKAKCFDLKNGGKCRCPIGMYNQSNYCRIGNTLIQIQRLKLLNEKISSNVQSNADSITQVEFASKVEPIIMRFLKTIFKSVVGVQLNKTKKLFDIFLVDFVVIFDQLFNDTKSLVNEIRLRLQNGLERYPSVTIQGDKEVMLSVQVTDVCTLLGDECGENAECVVESNTDYKCVCHYGYAMHYKECVKDKTALALKITVPLIVIITFVIFIGVIMYVIHKKPIKTDKGLLTFNNDEFLNKSEEDGNWKKTTYL